MESLTTHKPVYLRTVLTRETEGYVEVRFTPKEIYIYEKTTGTTETEETPRAGKKS